MLRFFVVTARGRRFIGTDLLHALYVATQLRRAGDHALILGAEMQW